MWWIKTLILTPIYFLQFSLLLVSVLDFVLSIDVNTYINGLQLHYMKIKAISD